MPTFSFAELWLPVGLWLLCVLSIVIPILFWMRSQTAAMKLTQTALTLAVRNIQRLEEEIEGLKQTAIRQGTLLNQIVLANTPTEAHA